jgi:hypothetical protein
VPYSVEPLASALSRPLHVSEMRLYQACPRKWSYAHVERRVPLERSLALSRGTEVHLWLAAWWAGHGSDVELPADPVARACCLGYGAYYGEAPEALWTLVEHGFECEVGGERVAGTVDALQMSAGKLLVWEHKTTSSPIEPGSPYWRQVVTCDPQVSMYLAVLPAAKVVYDVIRKPALRPLRAGKPNEETEDEYVARMVSAMAEEPERYFQRAKVVRLEADHEAFARDVVDVRRLMRTGVVPRNTSSCFDFGRRCEYFGVCFEGANLSGPDFRDQDEGR